MRIVGQYKDSDIRITDMYMSETYGGFLSLSEKRYEEVNRRLVNEDIPKMIERLWGQDMVFCVANLEKIDYKQLLPPVMVIAWFSCNKPVNVSAAHGSNLFIAWFQESDHDPFAKAVTNLKQISWEKQAEDFWY
jgi:hypothetical protein